MKKLRKHPVEINLNNLIIQILKKYPFAEQNLIWRISELQKDEYNNKHEVSSTNRCLIKIENDWVSIALEYELPYKDFYIYQAKFKVDEMHQQLYLDDSSYRYVSQSHNPIPTNLKMMKDVLSVFPDALEDALRRSGLNY